MNPKNKIRASSKYLNYLNTVSYYDKLLGNFKFEFLDIFIVKGGTIKYFH